MRNSFNFKQWLPTDVGHRVDLVLGILATIVLIFDLVMVVLRQAG